MKRTILFTAALASAVGLFALGARAQDQGAPAADPAPATDPAPAQAPMSLAQIATMLEGQGYTLREIELERGRYDVEMIDANGMKVEAYLDAVTGQVLPYRDDDDHAGYRGDDDRRHGRDDDR